MLPAAHRVTDAASFRKAVRRGRRASSSTLVAHLVLPAAVEDDSAGTPPARAGFVVSKAVGNSVVRNRVQRRLRHLVRRHLDAIPAGSVLVVRALPAAAGASSDVLDRDLVTCLNRVSRTPTGAPA